MDEVKKKVNEKSRISQGEEIIFFPFLGLKLQTDFEIICS